MLIYLDNCCFNRPFDDQKQIRIHIETEALIDLANKLNANGIKTKDALHIASSVALKCQYFITTDLYLIKKMGNFAEIKVVSPVDFINLL